MIALTELVEKGVDVDMQRQMVQSIAQQLMEIDVEGIWKFADLNANDMHMNVGLHEARMPASRR